MLTIFPVKDAVLDMILLKFTHYFITAITDIIVLKKHT